MVVWNRIWILLHLQKVLAPKNVSRKENFIAVIILVAAAVFSVNKVFVADRGSTNLIMRCVILSSRYLCNELQLGIIYTITLLHRVCTRCESVEQKCCAKG